MRLRERTQSSLLDGAGVRNPKREPLERGARGMKTFPDNSFSLLVAQRKEIHIRGSLLLNAVLRGAEFISTYHGSSVTKKIF